LEGIGRGKPRPYDAPRHVGLRLTGRAALHGLAAAVEHAAGSGAGVLAMVEPPGLGFPSNATLELSKSSNPNSMILDYDNGTLFQRTEY
jgi:hypothetical protein